MKKATRQTLGKVRQENRSRCAALELNVCGSSKDISLYLHHRAGDLKQCVEQCSLIREGEIRPDSDDDIAVGGKMLAVESKTLAQ